MKISDFFFSNKSVVTNVDETTYDNYREFDKIHLQHDWQTTDSVKERQHQKQTITVGID